MTPVLYTPCCALIRHGFLDSAARRLLPTFPAIRPHQTADSYLKPLEGILTRKDPEVVRKYGELIQIARYEEREPSETEYETCRQCSLIIVQTLGMLDS